ncbi:hypothetical protein HY745_03405 [Candidatus Desantisbacteria bacterium]|nr:hypothetical protein [Candidatus Desantisbacteria bacterium]
MNTVKIINKLIDSKNSNIEELIDQNGTGRAVFRNTRTSISGFPKRVAYMIPLVGSEEDLKLQTFEFIADQDKIEKEITFNYKKDPRIKWLVQFLKKHKNEKVLLISHSIKKVLAIEEVIKHNKIHIALFHEKLTLLQRDKNASWFAQTGGAQILICSEIGSEGRNFQFSHHLVLFDLPLNPELLEQRIGRLDRIGQQHVINIYIPYIIGSEYEIIARWYHEGIDAFKKNTPGVYQLFQESGEKIKKLALGKKFLDLNQFLKFTQKQYAGIAQTLKKGRDRLLELNSFRPKIAEGLIEKIKEADTLANLEEYMIEIFHLFGIREELISDRTYKLNLALLSSPEFPLPSYKKNELIVTFDRKTALETEDIEFLTWDHPMVLGAMDLILASEKGNCTAGIWSCKKTKEILLEAVFVLECVAPKYLYIDRFLPPAPLRVIVNHLMQDCTKKYRADLITENIENTGTVKILDNAVMKQELLHAMIKECNKIADKNAPEIIDNGLNLMKAVLTGEVSRLVELKKVNKNIKEEEISIRRQEMKLLEKAILSSRLRLDSLRLIIS